MALKAGDRVAWRNQYGQLKEIWPQEEPAPTMGVVAFDTAPQAPELKPLSELQAAADAPPPVGSPWAQAVADLAAAREQIQQLEQQHTADTQRIASLEQDIAALRAQQGGGGT